MVFTRYVEVGRVALINYGEDSGKLCTIINIVDGNRALVEGPQALTGVCRKMVNFKRLTLTEIKVNIGMQSKTSKLLKAWKDEDVLTKFAESDLGKTLDQRKKRASMSDFDRFKVMVARKQRSKAIKKKLAELRK